MIRWPVELERAERQVGAGPEEAGLDDGFDDGDADDEDTDIEDDEDEE